MDRHPNLTFARDLGPLPGRRLDLARRARQGIEVRVSRGVYTGVEEWRAADGDSRYLARIRAVAETRGAPPVISHWSAAAVHGLPMIGAWPQRVHITQRPGMGSRSRNLVARHSLPLSNDEVELIDGLRVTALARTVLDIAATVHTHHALVMADAALHEDLDHGLIAALSKDDLRAQWEARGTFTGFRRALAIIEFAETQAASPIESVSRLTMREIGAPTPVLQLAHFDAQGFIGYTDFAWPEYGAVAEADGRHKYLDPRFRNGRSADRVVVDEKDREDRLRALPRAFTRWGWQVAGDPVALRAKLVALGLPLASARR